MAIFTAIVAAIGLTGIAAAVASTVLTVAASFVVSKLIAPRGKSGTSQQEDAVTGSRVQLPPATNNKLPVVYGTAFVGGSITDAKISTDLQTMWYCLSIAEVTNTMPGNTPDSITFDQLYYDGKLVSLSGAQVTSLSTNTAGGAEVDTKINGNLFMYLFPNGSSSGINTGGQTAIQIMSDAAIPIDQRWTSSTYTSGGQSAAMTNTAFVIVKVIYNSDAGTTNLGAVTAKITNSRTKPGDCITDYLLNDRYGCAVPLAGIETTSMAALNDYSDKPIIYTPMGGGATTTQVRYRFNGPVDTTQNCLNNLQEMVDACDSWMQYSELTGKWKVVINKAYNETPDALTIDDLYSVTSNNLISGIQVNPTDLNQTFNQVEYQYPNTNIKDQLDFIFISLQDDLPGLLSENEPINKLGLKNDLVNNYVQAKFIAIRRLLQGREDLIITLKTDYSGIQVEAGDVIRVTNETYGWTEKLFRVSNVVEEKDGDGNLFASLTGFEYNGSIYDDDLDITDFIPADNTGLQDPNIIGEPDPPTVVLDESSSIYSLNVTGVVPAAGLVRYLEFNYGTDINSATHLYKTRSTNSNGAPLIGNTAYTVNINDIPEAGNLYWSVTARNDQVAIRSGSSDVVAWPGSNISAATTFVACNANSTGTLVTSDVITGNIVGGTVLITSGTGVLQANTIVANVVSNTQFNLNLSPTVDLANACIQIQTGGVKFIQMTSNAIGITNLAGWLMSKDRVGPIFENIANRSDYNYPCYQSGTTISSTLYNPWGQGTANTAQGFYGNSVSAFNPVTISAQEILPGYAGWEILTYVDWSGDNLTTDEVLDETLTLTALADADSRVQICQFAISNLTAPGYITLDTALQSDWELSSNTAFQSVFNTSATLAASEDIIYLGYAARNLTPGSNVYFTFCKFACSQRKVK